MTGPLHSNRRLDNNFVVAFDGGYPVQMSDCGDVAPALATFPSLNLSSCAECTFQAQIGQRDRSFSDFQRKAIGSTFVTKIKPKRTIPFTKNICTSTKMNLQTHLVIGNTECFGFEVEIVQPL